MHSYAHIHESHRYKCVESSAGLYSIFSEASRDTQYLYIALQIEICPRLVLTREPVRHSLAAI